MPEPESNKKSIRTDLLRRRNGLEANFVRRAGALVCRAITRLAAWVDASEVLLYMPLGNETDTAPLVRAAWDEGKRVLLPRCRPALDGTMDLACATCEADLSVGAYGITEPDPDACPALDEFAPDLAVIPGVAFDRRGARLGFGKGYYDRLLAGPGFEKTLLIGAAYSFQIVDLIPADQWDRPVHAVTTEETTIWMRP